MLVLQLLHTGGCATVTAAGCSVAGQRSDRPAEDDGGTHPHSMEGQQIRDRLVDIGVAVSLVMRGWHFRIQSEPRVQGCGALHRKKGHQPRSRIAASHAERLINYVPDHILRMSQSGPSCWAKSWRARCGASRASNVQLPVKSPHRPSSAQSGRENMLLKTNAYCSTYAHEESRAVTDAPAPGILNKQRSMMFLSHVDRGHA